MAAPTDTTTGAATGAARAGTAALPVALDLAGPLADGVRGWVEGVLGWQPVDATTSALVPPALRLVDVGHTRRTARHDVPPLRSTELPTLLLVANGDTPAAIATAAATNRPAAVVTWPEERDDLADVAGAVLSAPRPATAGSHTFRIGGAAGGVGTTTVVLALAGLAAWRGRPTLALVAASRLVPEVPVVPAAAVVAPDLRTRAVPLVGVPDALVLQVDGRVEREPHDDGAGLVVVDAGVTVDADVLVCRADAAGLGALAATPAGAAVVVGDGPASPRTVVRAASQRRVVTLPHSARVARAGLHGRVPVGLPGAWLRRLAPLVPRPVGG